MAIIPNSPSTDFTSTTLNGSINDSTTTITVNDASTIVVPTYAVIDREDDNGVPTPNQREVVYISGKSTNDCSVTRGVDNSTKRSHNDSAKFEPMITVGFWDDFYDAYDLEHSPADGSHDITKIAILSGATVQILANKILSGPTITSPTITSPTINTIRAWDGWNDANETWTYASASTITIPAGGAAKYAVGDRIKWTQTTVKYGVIVTVADTLLTIAVNTDYVVTNAAISANYYSHEASPIGYPQWFAYTPTGISASNVTHTGRFTVIGRRCFVNYHVAFTGGITYTTPPTLPIAASGSILGERCLRACGLVSYLDSGTAYVVGMLYPDVIANDTTCSLLVYNSGASMSATAPITWTTGDKLQADFSYEI